MTNKLIRIEELTLLLDEDEKLIEGKILKILNIKKADLIEFKIVKKAVDSRDKNRILFVYSLDINTKDNEKIVNSKNTIFLKNLKKHKIRLIEPFVYKIDKIDTSKLKYRPVIIGSGPSGLLAATILAEAGAKPIVLERGSEVKQRVIDVHNLFTKREFKKNSNVQFGEGGAGTFSDGKLYTLVNDPRSKYIFEEFVASGAPEEIIYSARPHIGTDRLRGVVRNMRKKIISLGGEVRFDTLMTDIETENGKVKNVVLENGEKIRTDDLIIAIGHSARDTYEMLYNKGLEIKQKPFAVGLRIEHPRELINKSQYGEACHHIKLGAASYKLVSHDTEERSVYSFCMCPGGHVVLAASEEGRLTVNGMSEYNQDSKNSNSALLVNVNTSDFGSDHPLAGVEFQRKWEEATFKAGGGNFNAPAQLVGDFLDKKASTKIGNISTTYKPEITLTSLDTCLPEFVIKAIRKALPILDKKIKGFADPNALLIGIEARTSSVIRMFRDSSCESNIKGIYPAGEGAGYAGGITSSAIDGLIVGENIIKKYI
ncbi:MAG: FAD-dependent monooxygenase [Candidatus Gracilibacteria bacterium]|nr:FAD-dependent monooxygenase [Candidatus Gracilibacteria bacterium]